ncbi:hypothetical protein [Mucilaginibacter sp. SJ]|uniref:hypothetical protein n=1 Tax=Mucilaginibacter sp. SJ TaxID=3029053 RepID=UPI0023A97104|nr:hypothetical protein [Mucilaginibacter sp. SJ]WEA01175.1 hypothetical protein MusilaSJ_27350 [Mucilaginibacter sp. SJ]
MGNITASLLPPQTWQEFEKLTKGVVDVIWPQHGWHHYGSQGQSQSGIDIFGYDHNNNFTGFQCKKKSLTSSNGELLNHSLLTKALIDSEIIAAEEIKNPSLDQLIFATTASRDTKIQDIIRDINHQRINHGKFKVDIWFWEDFQAHIERHDNLLYWYYTDILVNVHRYDKNVHFLSMLKMAFSRPAYAREIRGEESGGDFIKAIKDTMEAIQTGKLYNRRGDLLATSFPYTSLTQQEWRIAIGDIYKKLDEIRKLYQKGLQKKEIREHQTCLEVLNNELADQFNILRVDCLKSLNTVLSANKLESVDSELLHYRNHY